MEINFLVVVFILVPERHAIQRLKNGGDGGAIGTEGCEQRPSMVDSHRYQHQVPAVERAST